MSCHYSYERLLEAVRSGNMNEIEEAKFYLGKRTVYTPLLNGGDALCVAIEYGHKDLALELLQENSESYQYYNNYKKSRKASNLAQVACRNENIQIFEALIPLCPISTWISFDLMHSAAEQGFFPLMNLIIREVPKDDELIDNQTYNLDNIIPRFLDLSIMNGNVCHDKFHEEIMKNDIYLMYWRKIEPLHRAVFTKDMTSLNQIIEENKLWFDIRYTPFGFLNAMSVFGLVAMMGDEELLVYLYNLLGDGCSDFGKLRLAEEACDMACQRGRTNIVKRLLSENWIDGNWNKLWDSRMNAVLSKKRNDTAHLLLDLFFYAHVPLPPASSIRMRDIVSTGNAELCRKAMKSLQDIFVADWEANNELWAGYKHALEEGYPEILKLFIDALGFMDEIGRQSPAVRLSPEDKVFTETMKKIAVMSAVNVELLLQCYFAVNQTIPSLPGDDGIAIFLAYMIRECPEKLTVPLNELIVRRLKINSYQLLDYCDICEEDVSFLHHSEKNVDIYRLCNLFRLCAGSNIIWTGLLHSAIHLNDEGFDLFCKFAQHYRVAINNDRLHLEREKCCDCRANTDNLSNKYQRTLDIFRYGVSTTTTPSLQDHCRITIRRAIYKTNSLMSKSDRILSLHKYHNYPKELVRYLLYREDGYERDYRNHILLDYNDVETPYELSDDEDDFYSNVYDEYELYEFDDEDDFDDFLDDDFDEEGDENADEFRGAVIRLA